MIRSSLLILIFACLFIEIGYATKNSFCRDQTLECMEEEHLHNYVKGLQDKVQELRSHLTESNCTICNVVEQPCLNGGTCSPTNDYNWTCICPYNYAGVYCEKNVTCDPSPCGPGANCTVFNHRPNCACPFGYSGDPYSSTGCQNKTVTSCMSGDPHYYSFDRNYFDYQGTCPYIVSTNCNPGNIAPYEDFVVKARNTLVGSTGLALHVAGVVEVEVETNNLTIHIDKNFNLYINGTIRSYDYFYPNSEDPLVSVTNNQRIITIARRDGLTVTFQTYTLCVTIPDVPELQGQDKLCGLAGNRDFNCTDDLKLRNGTIIPDSSCSHNINYIESEYFGDSWIISQSEFLNTTGPYSCEPGHIVANISFNCTADDRTNITNACLPILQAENATGIFAVCSPLGAQDLSHFYETCVFDVCIGASDYCSELADFVQICQDQVPFANVGDWRTKTGCPAYACTDPDSTYSPCASRCQPTCQHDNGTYGDGCIDTCTEGCVCNPGYVVDNNAVSFKCIKIEDCGCEDDDGNSYPANSTWLTDDCSVRHTCLNGTIQEVPNACGTTCSCGSSCSQCVINSGVMQCACDPGFSGDGYTCSDIDECNNPSECSADQGWGDCNNTCGSYQCTCRFNNNGANCQNYQPRRHCADLFVYNNITESGAYTIYPTSDESENVTAYCDMITEGGGWTMARNSTANVSLGKNFEEYEAGFGDPFIEEEIWLGLKWIHFITNATNATMSLRVNIIQCGQPLNSYCTYPEFVVYGNETKYQVFIPAPCNGTYHINSIQDGWISWINYTTTAGPRFYTYDDDVPNLNCAQGFFSTGWWYDRTHFCGNANLNGLPINCENIPQDPYYYIEYNRAPISMASMFLRPADFPTYDYFTNN